MDPDHVLPDVLEPGLVTVFCGSAVGFASAQAGAYYAQSGNRFWTILDEAGFTDRRLAPEEYPSLPDYGLGLTDLAKHEYGNDADLSGEAYQPAALLAKIERYRPRFLAFTAKTPAQVFVWDRFGAELPRGTGGYGPTGHRFGPTELWVLPSTSGRARSHWRPEPWHALARLHRRARQRPDPA